MVSSKLKNSWYIGGLHFACQKCGRCCSGPEEGVIWISKPEIRLLAQYLGLEISELRKKYLRRIGFRFSIKENPHSKDCIFLVDKNSLAAEPVLCASPNSAAGDRYCAIYDVRPLQCRTWPFWSSNLQSPDDWNTAAAKCPGINKGRFYSLDEIEKIRNQKKWWEHLASLPTIRLQNSNHKQAVILKICSEVKRIYDWLDFQLKRFNNQCALCGRCCNFDSFGHRLFVTTPELLYFKQNVRPLKQTAAGVCPYLKDGKCSVREYRFAACRIFFCKADRDFQNRLSEEVIKNFKMLCEKYELPYRYMDINNALNAEY